MPCLFNLSINPLFALPPPPSPPSRFPRLHRSPAATGDPKGGSFFDFPRGSHGSMGKYMKKTKMAGEVAVMDVVSQSPLGVRTRARTLALQKLAVAVPPPPAAASGSYLQLRSRRLLKHVAAAEAKKPSRDAGKKAEEEGDGCGGEASSGENSLGRITRESTPSNLIRDSETLGTPGSTNRPTGSCPINVRTRTAARRSIPTTREMEEFFAGAERQQQRIFTEKYNYDPVKDMPLPGRYEWVRLK